MTSQAEKRAMPDRKIKTRFRVRPFVNTFTPTCSALISTRLVIILVAASCLRFLWSGSSGRVRGIDGARGRILSAAAAVYQRQAPSLRDELAGICPTMLRRNMICPGLHGTDGSAYCRRRGGRVSSGGEICRKKPAR